MFDDRRIFCDTVQECDDQKDEQTTAVYIQGVSKKLAPLKLFGMSSLRLSLFV